MNEGQQYEDPSVEMPTQYAQENSAEQLKYLLESDDLMLSIENFLRGKVFDYGKKEYVEKFKPKANNEGINHILSRLTPHAHKNIMLSHIKEKNINAIMKEFSRNFARDIVLYCDDWGVKDADIIMIWEFVTNMVYAAFCRAEGGIEKRFLKGTMYMGYQENNLTGGSMPQEGRRSGGFLNNLNPFKGGE